MHFNDAFANHPPPRRRASSTVVLRKNFLWLVHHCSNDCSQRRRPPETVLYADIFNCICLFIFFFVPYIVNYSSLSRLSLKTNKAVFSSATVKGIQATSQRHAAMERLTRNVLQETADTAGKKAFFFFFLFFYHNPIFSSKK